MDPDYKTFIDTLYKFVSDLNRYSSTKGSTDLLSQFDKLNVNKLILRFYSMTRNVSDLIKSKNDTLFNNSFVILPGIDLQYYWTVLNTNQKKKVWIYIQLLFSLCDKIVDIEKKKIVDTKDEFNPYVGVEGSDLDAENIQTFNTVAIPNSSNTSMLDTLGISKMLNMNNVKDILKNMSDEDIEKATSSIGSMIGNNDESTTKFLSSIFKNVGQVLNDPSMDNNTNGDFLSGIKNLVEKLSDKMGPELENINAEQFLENMTKNINSKYDKNMFPPGLNPMELAKKLMSDNKNVSPEEYIDKCSDLCKNIGINPNDFKNLINDNK